MTAPYRLRTPAVVRAAQWEGTGASSEAIRRAFNYDTAELSRAGAGRHDLRLTGFSVAAGTERTLVVPVFAWVVRDHFGHDEVLSNSEFQSLYEPVP